MDSFKQYLLLEKTFNLNKDVDYIYNKFFKAFIKKVRADKWNGDALPYKEIHSADLITKDAKKAHELNPIRIVIGNSNTYTPSNSKINLSPSKFALGYISTNKGFSNAIKHIKEFPNNPNLNDDISMEKMKASIYHELAHWIDDSTHNFYITRTLQRANHNKKHAREIMNQGHASVDQTSFEINAQIHALKQRKRTFSKSEWDNLKFDDILATVEPFKHLRKMFKLNPKEYTEWRKKILKRLSREKLLGKNMKIRRKFR